MLQLVAQEPDESLDFLSLSVSLLSQILVPKAEGNPVAEKPGRHFLNQVNLTNETNSHRPADMMHEATPLLWQSYQKRVTWI